MTKQHQENLRKFLATIVTKKNEKEWSNPSLFRKNIMPIFPKEIEIVALPPNDKNQQFNCFLYVFGLYDNRRITKESGGFIYSLFVEKLIEKNEMQEKKNPVAGDLVFYRNPRKFGKMFTHAGILVDDGLVTSKWSWGPLLKHKLLDVPDFYGDETSYYKPVSREKILELYHKHKKYNRP